MKLNKLKQLVMTQPSEVSFTQDDIADLQRDVTILLGEYASLNDKINNISSLFGITYNSDNTIATEAYTTHTHSYTDSTIADTADGSGTQTDTTKTTGGIN